MVIAGAHTLLYADDAEAARAFFRDVLDLENVDAGGGWLIFALPPGELGIHPGAALSGGGTGRSELYFMCHDVERTVEDLRRKGVEFVGDVSEESYGREIKFTVPGYGHVWLYEPKHASPLSEFSD